MEHEAVGGGFLDFVQSLEWALNGRFGISLKDFIETDDTLMRLYETGATIPDICDDISKEYGLEPIFN